MTVNINNAIAAYGKTMQPMDGGMEARDGSKSQFANLVQNFVGGGVDALKQSETKALGGLAGTVDLTDVVTAISKAEITLQAVVAVRDKVINGYQEIMRMPI